MYCVIQFDETGNNSVAVVNHKWLTPLKKEVFWPPYKETRQVRRALENGDDVEQQRWALYGVRRIFYQTDDLQKAYKKEKQAEISSDVCDTTDLECGNERGIRPIRNIRKPSFIDSSDESEIETNYSRPTKVTIKKLTGKIETLQLPSPSLKPAAVHDSSSEVLTSNNVINTNPVISDPSAYTSTKTFVAILNTIKEQNKIILSKLEIIEKKLASQDDEADSTQRVLPVELPLKLRTEMYLLENYLKEDEQHLKSLVKYFMTLGGKDTKTKVSTILRKVLTDTVASSFSYFGKRGKEAFFDSSINKALIRAVQNKDQNATVTDIEDAIKQWIKHAPDRMKSRK